MRTLSAMIGGAIVGALAFGLWPELWMTYGMLGGWVAATVAIGTSWFMNHHLGIIPNPPDEAWVDMGWAVGAAGVGWAMVRFYPDADLLKAVPTLVCCLIGGGLAGIAAEAIKKRNPNFVDSADAKSEQE